MNNDLNPVDSAPSETAAPEERVVGMTESELTGATPPEETTTAPGENTGTQPPNFNGTPQQAQESRVEPNFNEQVTQAVNATTDVQVGESGELPGGVVQQEGDGELVLSVNYDEEVKTYTFAVDEAKSVAIDDKLSGAASVSLNINGIEDGKKHGTVSVRIIGDHASRVYLFRKETDEAVTFTAKFTAHP